MTMIDKRNYKIVKHEEPGTGFWTIMPISIWHQTFYEENYDLDSKGLNLFDYILRLAANYIIPA